MGFRKVAASRGVGWITDGIAVFSARPGPFLGTCFLVGLLSALPLVSFVFGLLGVFFYGGLIQALHTQATGGTPSGDQAFDGFRRPGAFGRLLPIAAVNIAVALLAAIILVATVGPMLIDLVPQGANAKPDPAKLIVLLPKLGQVLLLLLPVGVFVGWITLLAVPRAMLDEVPGVSAMSEAVSAIFANWGALLVNLLCLIASLMVMTLLMMIPMLLVNQVSAGSQAVAMIVQIPLMAIFGTMIFALYCSIMYQAWREIFGGVSAPAPPLSQVEV